MKKLLLLLLVSSLGFVSCNDTSKEVEPEGVEASPQKSELKTNLQAYPWYVEEVSKVSPGGTGDTKKTTATVEFTNDKVKINGQEIGTWSIETNGTLKIERLFDFTPSQADWRIQKGSAFDQYKEYLLETMDPDGNAYSFFLDGEKK